MKVRLELCAKVAKTILDSMYEEAEPKNSLDFLLKMYPNEDWVRPVLRRERQWGIVDVHVKVNKLNRAEKLFVFEMIKKYLPLTQRVEGVKLNASEVYKRKRGKRM